MGILCDLFVADPADAPRYAQELDAPDAADRFEVVALGGFTQLQFEILWAITEGCEWRPETHSFEWVGEPPEDPVESWLFRFPTAFVQRLARLKQAEIASAATKWAATDEVDGAPHDVLPVVESLVELARSAVQAGRGLYLWGSL